MRQTTHQTTNRRDFLKTTGAIAGGVAVTGLGVPAVHAADDNTIRIALVGCGGRGTGAAGQALSVEKQGPIKLVAMADVFQTRLDRAATSLRRYGDQIDCPKERQFIGFEAYKQAMDCLSPGDVIILATPPAFRWVHFTYAIQKGLNVFMEKPVTVDGPTTRKMLKLAEESVKKNLKVGVGLMIRHCRGRQELLKRIRDGEIGDIQYMRAYRMGAGSNNATAGPRPPSISEVLYQVQRFHSFLWASGGVFNDYNIHQIDETSWMKGAWPIKAHALGGRHYRGRSIDQNFDVYDVEYVYEDGTRMFFQHRQMPGCHMEFASYVHGSKGSAIVSTSSHVPGKVRTFKGQNMTRENQLWAYPQPEKNPYQLEWDDLIQAIRQDKAYNEVQRGAEVSLVTSMGRMAAHTGQIVTYEQALNCDHEFAPEVDKLTLDGPAPLRMGEEGKYPMPMPGVITKREY
jgi:predicted dehydrogenase